MQEQVLRLQAPVGAVTSPGTIAAEAGDTGLMALGVPALGFCVFLGSPSWQQVGLSWMLGFKQAAEELHRKCSTIHSRNARN